MLHPKRRIRPAPHGEGLSEDVASLIDTYFNAYNSARLREACQTFARMIDDGTTIGLSIAGALTPAGLSSVLVPLMQAGFIDYISSTGANLYHDLHFDLDLPLYRGQPDVVSGAHDVALRKDGIIRVYDVLFPADVLYKTDEWLYRVMMSTEFRKRMSGSELHHLIGKYALETARKLARSRSRRCWRSPTSWTCRSGSRRRAIRPSASTWRPSTRRRPSAARTWIRPPTSPRCRRWCWTPSASRAASRAS